MDDTVISPRGRRGHRDKKCFPAAKSAQSFRGLVQYVLSPRRYSGAVKQLDCRQALGIKGYTLGVFFSMRGSSEFVTAAEIFHWKFCPGIRVQFNWRRFFVENWPVEVVVLRDKHGYAAMRLPWYLDKSNEFVNFDAPDASPVRLSDVAKWFDYLPNDRRETIKRFEGEIRSGVRNTEFEFPLYALPENQYLVLDGNHNLSALTFSEQPFSVRMYVVRGPIDPNVLPDLVHFAT